MSDDGWYSLGTLFPEAPFTFDADPMNARVPGQLVRATDPDTSTEAAASIISDLKELQDQVYRLFQDYGPMTHGALIDRYRGRYGVRSDSTIRTRCAELVEANFLRDTGERVVLDSGRKAVVWGLV